MDRPRFWRLANSQDWCHCAHFQNETTSIKSFHLITQLEIFFVLIPRQIFSSRWMLLRGDFVAWPNGLDANYFKLQETEKNEISPEWNICKTWFGSKVVFACIFWGKSNSLFSAFLRAWIKWPENCCLFYFETDRFSLFINWCNRLAQDFYPNLSSFFVFSRKSIVPMLRIKGGENLPGCIKRWRYLLLTKRTTGGLWIGLL